MSKFTDFLNLFMWDSIEDSEEEFNIDKALNDNWKKIDTKVKTHVTSVNEEINNFKEETNQKIENIQALPVGGTKGQVLTKQSETEGDANWEDIEANEVFVGNEEEAPETAKIIVEEDDFVEGSTLSKAEVYVGAEEPTTGEKVWFRKGKNLCNGINQHCFLTTAANTCNTTTSDTGLAIPVKKGTYTISTKTTQARYRVAFVNSFPTGDSVTAYSGVNKDGTNESITIENSNNYKYLIVNATDLSSILVEQGSKATSYEAYIEPQIFVRNSNGVYEEFTKNDNVISGQVTATTDNVGRILVPIPLGATGANVISVEGNYFTFLRPLQSNKTNSLCYLKDTDNMQAIVNTSVTVVWSYIK